MKINRQKRRSSNRQSAECDDGRVQGSSGETIIKCYYITDDGGGGSKEDQQSRVRVRKIEKRVQVRFIHLETKTRR